MSIKTEDYNTINIPTWCPGCGNFSVQAAIKKSLSELNISPSEVFMAFDIGCSGNGAGTINTYAFKGLHGRAIPLAVGAHLANRRFVTIANIGDGGCFHEGLDHLVHAILSNYNITIIIHNNGSFALTTGQATVTTQKNKPVYAFPKGKTERPLDISKFILNLAPSFYARGYSQDPNHLSEILTEAVKNEGCSIVEVLQICPTYNKDFTMEWANQNIKKVETIQKYDNTSLAEAIQILDDKYKYTGIIYRNLELKPFYDLLENRKNSLTELVDEVKTYNIKNLLKSLK